MNKPTLDPIANWMVDCLMTGDIEKANKLEEIYKRMFDKQWKYYNRRGKG